MKTVHVRSHSRRSPTRRGSGVSPQGKMPDCLPKVLVGVISLFFLAWLVSRTPLWLLILIAFIIVVVAGAILSLMIRHNQHGYQEITRGPQSPQAEQRPTPTSYQSGYRQEESDRRHKERMASLKTLGDVLTLTPPEFEEFCGKLLELLGYVDIQVIGKPGDLGVDLWATDPYGKSTMIQCKKYGPGRKVNSGEFQKFLGTMVTVHHAEKGIYITTSDFAQSIAKIKHDRTIILINGERLAQLIHQTASMWS